MPWAITAVGRERAFDGAGTCRDAIKRIKARHPSASSLSLQIPSWSHFMHTEAVRLHRASMTASLIDLILPPFSSRAS